MDVVVYAVTALGMLRGVVVRRTRLRGQDAPRRSRNVPQYPEGYDPCQQCPNPLMRNEEHRRRSFQPARFQHRSREPVRYEWQRQRSKGVVSKRAEHIAVKQSMQCAATRAMDNLYGEGKAMLSVCAASKSITLSLRDSTKSAKSWSMSIPSREGLAIGAPGGGSIIGTGIVVL